MGAGGVIIILKAVKSALQVGVTKSGRIKLYHAVILVFLLGFVLGALIF